MDGVVAEPPSRARSTPVCDHCGEPCPAASAGSGPAFCCGGCELAWALCAGGDNEDADQGRAQVALVRFVVGAFFAMNVMAFSLVLYAQPHAPTDSDAALFAQAFRVLAACASLPALALLGLPLALGVWRAPRARPTDALVMLGVGGATFASFRAVLTGVGHVYLDTACMTLLFLHLGRFMSARARARAAASVRRAASATPREAHRLDGEVPGLAPLEAIPVGARIRVDPEQVVPLDGRVIGEPARLDQAPVTGESRPIPRAEGEAVFAGSRVLGPAPLVMEVTGGVGQRLLDEMDALLEVARRRGTPLLGLADRVSRFFLFGVATLAVITFFFWSPRIGGEVALTHALAVLLAACPCALGVAAPLAHLRALAHAAERGVAVRDGGALERLASVDTVFFDKTGTLTRPTAGGNEELRPGAVEAIRRLRKLGLEIRVLSGDTPDRVEAVAAALEVPAEAELLPQEKAACVEEARTTRRILYVGDGMNDAPGLGLAHVGIALGDGTELARQAAEVVLLRPDPGLVPDLVILGRRARSRLARNLSWAFGYNLALLGLAASGHLHPGLAAAAMVVSSLSLVAASARPLALPKRRRTATSAPGTPEVARAHP